jgi:hypothetical protein
MRYFWAGKHWQEEDNSALCYVVALLRRNEKVFGGKIGTLLGQSIELDEQEKGDVFLHPHMR